MGAKHPRSSCAQQIKPHVIRTGDWCLFSPISCEPMENPNSCCAQRRTGSDQTTNTRRNQYTHSTSLMLGRSTGRPHGVFLSGMPLRPTKGDFQITTDGFAPYRDAIGFILGGRTDFAQIVKIYANNPESETRYSPAECTGCKKKVIHGRPDMERVGTSRIERHNLSVRMENRRFTRLTNGFSKKWEKHHAALALYFAYYNFCRMHKTLRCTPAMAAGVVDHVWTVKDLLTAATAL